jgi:hypothetical protein
VLQHSRRSPIIPVVENGETDREDGREGEVMRSTTAEVTYNVEQFMCSADESKKFNGADYLYWLVRLVKIGDETISTERVAVFNYDSEAVRFKTFLEGME